jgi:hypothetical protein
MSNPQEYRDQAKKLRKIAADLKQLKETKAEEKREKCAAVIVAKVGLEELKNKLSNGRR